MSQFSDDAKLIAAMLAPVEYTLPPDSCWAEVDALIAAAPAGDAASAAPTAQTAEPTEKEWRLAYFETGSQIGFPSPWLYARDISAEAHRLAALRVTPPGPEAAKERA